MVSLSPGGGLGNILDSAVKTAVTHLASSPTGIDRSRVDFLYNEDESPPYYDYYYDDDHTYIDNYISIEPPTDALISPPDNKYSPPNPPAWTKHFTPKPPHWARENQQNFPPRPDDHQNSPPRPHFPPNNHLNRRVDRQSSVFSLANLSAYLPFLVILPVIAAASYYLVVQNGPTPVVKEKRGGKQVAWPQGVPSEQEMNILSTTDNDYGEKDDHKDQSLNKRQSKKFTPAGEHSFSKQLKVNK